MDLRFIDWAAFAWLLLFIGALCVLLDTTAMDGAMIEVMGR